MIDNYRNHKVGDTVIIRSKDWYHSLSKNANMIHYKCGNASGGISFDGDRYKYLSMPAKITAYSGGDKFYKLDIDGNRKDWCDEMFEDISQEEAEVRAKELFETNPEVKKIHEYGNTVKKFNEEIREFFKLIGDVYYCNINCISFSINKRDYYISADYSLFDKTNFVSDISFSVGPEIVLESTLINTLTSKEFLNKLKSILASYYKTLTQYN